MRPIQHHSSNAILRPPAGTTNDECRPLAIRRFEYEGGLPAVASFWEPTDAERAAIAAGAKVMFTCWGHTHPPVYLGVDGVNE